MSESRFNAAEKTVARLDDVNLRYGKGRALANICLDVPAGCMVGLIGPDGVGKSSLLALIAGARKIQGGRIEVIADAFFRASRSCLKAWEKTFIRLCPFSITSISLPGFLAKTG